MRTTSIRRSSTDEHQKIIDALEAIPEGERTPEQDLELARAYNNQGDPGTPEGRALFQRAIELMEPHRAVLGEDYSWNFRMGYAHYYLDREEQALGYFQKALALHPGDDPQYNTEEEIRFFIDDCRRWIAVQSGEGIVLTPEDVEELEGMCEGPSGYFYKMLSYLENAVLPGGDHPGRGPGGPLLRGPGQGRPGGGPVVLLRLQQCGRVRVLLPGGGLDVRFGTGGGGSTTGMPAP